MPIDTIVSWWDAHAAVLAVVLAVATTAARALWTALGPSVRARNPRIHAAIEALGAISPDLWRAVVVVARAVSAARAAQPPSGRSGEAGRASPAALALAAFVGLLALVFVGLALQGCDPTREAILRATPTVPRVDGCTPGDLRCHDNAPEVCSASGRWWPALSRHADGTPRTCVGSCRIEDGDAYCSPLVEGDPR